MQFRNDWTPVLGKENNTPLYKGHGVSPKGPGYPEG